MPVPVHQSSSSLLGCVSVLVVCSMVRAETYFVAPLTFKTQYPNVPKETEERCSEVRFESWTLMMDISFTTGDVIVVTRRRAVATRRRNVPTWWKIPVRPAILCCSDGCCLRVAELLCCKSS